MSNPLLERIKIPGETVRLPSLGIFYKDGELSPECKNGEVHVYPMSAYDEIIMHSPDKLLNGHAIAEVFSRCIPDVLQPLRLFSKDVDYLMMCLRRVTYGPSIDIDYRHTCENAKNNTYTLDVSKFINSAKTIDPTLINTLYTLILENGQIVKLHPIRLQDVILLMQETQKVKEVDYNQAKLLDSLVNVIESVDDINDKTLILEWVRAIPVKLHKQLSRAVENSSDWGSTTESVEKCKDCGADIKLEVPLNPLTFFI